MNPFHREGAETRALPSIRSERENEGRSKTGSRNLKKGPVRGGRGAQCWNGGGELWKRLWAWVLKHRTRGESGDHSARRKGIIRGNFLGSRHSSKGLNKGKEKE